MSDTTVQKIEEELAAFDEDEAAEVEETTEVESESEYVAPLLFISRTRSVGEHTDSIRIELQESKVMDSPGAVISFAESALRALQVEESPAAGSHNIEMHFLRLSPEMQAVLQQRVEQAMRPTDTAVAAPAPSAKDLQEALEDAHRRKAESDREHDRQVGDLRALILQARSDKAAADKAETADNRAAGLFCALCKYDGPGLIRSADKVGNVRGVLYDRLSPDVLVCTDSNACRERRDEAESATPDAVYARRRAEALAAADLGDAVQADAQVDACAGGC